jgi:LAO/AO transport system kinase
LNPLAEQILAGRRRAIARQISQIENNQPEALHVLTELYPYTGRAYLVGITGPPGSGKSTLVNGLAKAYRQRDKTVAILAVDPSSPFSGGAILGDRIRLNDLAGDSGVFVRSMATRGTLGGLARAAGEAIHIFDAAGFDLILIETVGVGQAEVEIAGLAYTVLVIDVPGLGDDVQAIKAGLLEIADIFVVNKADREGADRVAAALKMMLQLSDSRGQTHSTLHHGQLLDYTLPAGGGPRPAKAPLSLSKGSRDSGELVEGGPGWQPLVCKTVATTGAGIDKLVEAIEQHRARQIDTNGLKERARRRLAFDIEQALKERLLRDLITQVSAGQLHEVIEQVVNRQLDPYSAVETLLMLGNEK